LNVFLSDADALVISHLHPDHMGGMKAMNTNTVCIPDSLGDPGAMPCILPERADAPGFSASVATGPGPVTGWIATTGPLARSLFFAGLCEEQALVARIEGKGLVVITGCGHPTIQVILEMVEKMHDDPIYAVIGGLHFPITAGRDTWAGIHGQMLLGTGYPVWRRIREEDLDLAADAINRAGAKRVLLSPHDTCDYGLERFRERLDAEVTVLEAGGTYRIE
jgi:7,8-dihydropterin-6-yl-methyl-4-(beta-D-ribofuranosyl)aminobenzene 5'-phosphate synthase